ncbi:MAG: LacI family DNA-binding transcriptional regulator [Christensenellales bacterium]|jgi:LacI family transcriptional regulator
MAITSVELARLAGVSRTTVDRALKGKRGISEETRARILRIARENRYRPNAIASSLSTGKSASVGIIVFDLNNQHFTDMTMAIEEYFAQRGVLSYICLSRKDIAREKELIENLCDKWVDGIILLPVGFGEVYGAWLRSENVPIVTVSNRVHGFPFVSGDNESASLTGMKNLYSRGYREIHFLCPPMRNKGKQNIYAQEARANGYLRFLKAHEDVYGELIIEKDFFPRVTALMQGAKSKPAFFCSSDTYLLELRRFMIDEGIDLVKSCALMGFDGLDYLSQFTRRPTSIRYPASEIGKCAAEMLDKLMRGDEVPDETLLPCPLLPGNIPD